MRPLPVIAALVLLTMTPPGQAHDGGEIMIGDVSYPRLADAIANAQPHETIMVHGGTHEGPLDVNTSLTIRGIGQPRILGNGVSTVVTIRAENVTIGGFAIEGSGSRHDTGDAGIAVLAANATIVENTLARNLFGVWVAQAAHTRIENNTIVGDPAYDEARRGDGIRLWYSPHAIVRNNTLDGTRDLIGWYARDLTIEDNLITRGRYGLHLMYCSDATIQRNEIADSSVGIYTMSSSRVAIAENHIHESRGTSGYALAFKDVDDVTATGNILADNGVGIYLDTTPFSPDGMARFTRNVLATNDVGVLVLPAVERNEFTDNTFWDNLAHVDIHGGHATGANTWRGNYWSGFAGYDADGDGYSEAPYRADRLFESLAGQDTRLRALAHTPLADALEATANAFPIVKPEPKLEDPSPRTTPPALPFEPRVAHASAIWAAQAAAFAGLLIVILPFATSHILRHTRMPPTTPQATALRIRDLTTGYGEAPILDDICLELAAGEAVALWGENGAGKTTLLRAILGLIPHQGTVEVLGIDTKRDPRAARSRIGYVPQDVRLEDATIRDVMHTYASLRGARRDEANDLLERLGLSEHAQKRTSELSGGLRQRLALALALLGDPHVLLLDEPTANLDAAAREAYLKELQALTRRGKAILFTSHRTDEVVALAARVTVLRRARHETLQTRQFLDARHAEASA